MFTHSTSAKLLRCCAHVVTGLSLTKGWSGLSEDAISEYLPAHAHPLPQWLSTARCFSRSYGYGSLSASWNPLKTIAFALEGGLALTLSAASSSQLQGDKKRSHRLEIQKTKGRRRVLAECPPPKTACWEGSRASGSRGYFCNTQSVTLHKICDITRSPAGAYAFMQQGSWVEIAAHTVHSDAVVYCNANLW